MSDIFKAIYWYLVDDFSTLTDATREDARNTMRSHLTREDGGVAVYHGNIPQGRQSQKGRLALVVTRSGGFSIQAIDKPTGINSVVFDFEIVAKSSVTWRIIEELSQSLINALVAYRGTWNDSPTTTIQISALSEETGPFLDTVPPADASDNWIVSYVHQFRIGYIVTVPATGGA